MRVLGFNRFPLVPVLAALTLLPGGVRGQLRPLVSSEIDLGESGTALRLAFQDQGSFSIEFLDGRVLVDGSPVGSYVRRDALESAWRSFLGDIITLQDGALAQALVDWAPPEGLADSWAEVAAELDQALEQNLTLPASAEDPSPVVQTAISGEADIIAALLGRPEVLSGLAQALEGISMDKTTLLVGEDMVVEAGNEMDGTLILVDGDLEVAGLIDGDVVLTGGAIQILEGGRITGNLRVVDGDVLEIGDAVDGMVVELDQEGLIQLTEEELAELTGEVEELRAERDRRATTDRRSRSESSFVARAVARVSSGIGELLKNFLTFLFLCFLGVLAVHFQGDRMEVVATTARRAPTRSALVGLAGGFLLLPVWIVGALALAISIIGIPVLVAWVPFFPIAAGLAALLGLLAVARNVGEWVADQEYKGLEWIRGSNSFYTIIAGVGALMVPCVASNVLSALGVDWLASILASVGWMISLAAATVGLGAVLLTRGGRIRPHESYFDYEDEFWVDAEPVPADEGDSDPSPDEGQPEDLDESGPTEGEVQANEEEHEEPGDGEAGQDESSGANDDAAEPEKEG